MNGCRVELTEFVVGNPKSRTSRVLDTDWADYEDPRWAPDGRHIVCSRTSGYRSAIYLLDTQKDSPVALISGSGDWYSPAVGLFPIRILKIFA